PVAPPPPPVPAPPFLCLLPQSPFPLPFAPRQRRRPASLVSRLRFPFPSRRPTRPPLPPIAALYHFSETGAAPTVPLNISPSRILPAYGGATATGKGQSASKRPRLLRRSLHIFRFPLSLLLFK